MFALLALGLYMGTLYEPLILIFFVGILNSRSHIAPRPSWNPRRRFRPSAPPMTYHARLGIMFRGREEQHLKVAPTDLEERSSYRILIEGRFCPSIGRAPEGMCRSYSCSRTGSRLSEVSRISRFSGYGGILCRRSSSSLASLRN